MAHFKAAHGRLPVLTAAFSWFHCQVLRGHATRWRPEPSRGAVEIWCREPARDWPNPSLISPDDILTIDYFDDPDTIET